MANKNVAQKNIGRTPNAATDYDAPTKRSHSRVALRMDYSTIVVVVFLVIFGLIAVYSASSYTATKTYGDSFYFLRKQAIFSFLGILLMIGVSRLDYNKFVNKFMAIGFIGAASLVMLLVNFTSFGIEKNGSKRWFGIGGTSIFQPVELVKLAVIVFCAYYINKHLRSFEYKQKLFIFAVICGLPIALVGMNNLSSGIIVLMMALVIFFVSCQTKKKFYWIFGGILLVVLLVVFCWPLMKSVMSVLPFFHDYQTVRIDVWKDPTAYSQDGGYQVLQGLYAIGSAGFFGKGLGASMQKIDYMPEAQNDMIFSIIVEEFGIFGALCLMAAFAYLVYKLIKIAQNAPDLKGTLIVVGVIVQISMQVILNIAVVTNAIPNTGVSLPFISYGGSSVVFLLFEMGLVLSVANRIPKKRKYAESRKRQADNEPKPKPEKQYVKTGQASENQRLYVQPNTRTNLQRNVNSQARVQNRRYEKNR